MIFLQNLAVFYLDVFRQEGIYLDEFRHYLDIIQTLFRQNLDQLYRIQTNLDRTQSNQTELRQNLDKIQTEFRQNLDRIQTEFRQNLDTA